MKVLLTRPFRRHWLGYCLLVPALLFVFFISIYPIVYALDWSLYRTQYLHKAYFVGIDNYVRVFKYNIHALLVSVYYCFGSLLLSVPISVVVATLLDRPVIGRAVFRTIILIPWTLSQAVVGLLWKWLLEPSFGPVNYLLEQLGVGPIFFFASPSLALPTLIAINVWMTYPLGVVLVLAALQTVPSELMDAARIDGAGTWRVFLHVKLPHIMHTVLVTVILQSLLYFNMVTLIYVTTAGGPLRVTETLSIHLIKSAFERWQVGYASAVGVIMLVFNVTFSIFYIKALRAEE